MSLQAVVVPPIPAETLRVAQAIFCKGNLYMQMRDELGGFYQDRQFAGDAVADRVGFRSVFWLWVAVAIDARYHDLAERLCRLGRAYWNHPNRVPPPESAVLTAR
jgi:hypothetical protein